MSDQVGQVPVVTKGKTCAAKVGKNERQDCQDGERPKSERKQQRKYIEQESFLEKAMRADVINVAYSPKYRK